MQNASLMNVSLERAMLTFCDLWTEANFNSVVFAYTRSNDSTFKTKTTAPPTDTSII